MTKGMVRPQTGRFSKDVPRASIRREFPLTLTLNLSESGRGFGHGWVPRDQLVHAGYLQYGFNMLVGTGQSQLSPPLLLPPLWLDGPFQLLALPANRDSARYFQHNNVRRQVLGLNLQHKQVLSDV